MPGPLPNSVKTSDLKNKILNLAQTSVYQVRLTPPPSVSRFLQNRRFVYQGSDIELLCSDTALPGNSLATHETNSDYMGVTEKMAYRRLYDDTIDMVFYVDKKYKVIEFFDGWMDYITGQGTTGTTEQYKNRRQGYRMNYPNSYKTNIYLTKFEKDNSNEALYYTFVDAFPISVVSTPLSYGPSDILRYNISFSYVRYVRERKQLLESNSNSTITGSVVTGDTVTLPSGEEIPLNGRLTPFQNQSGSL